MGQKEKSAKNAGYIKKNVPTSKQSDKTQYHQRATNYGLKRRQDTGYFIEPITVTVPFVESGETEKNASSNICDGQDKYNHNSWFLSFNLLIGSDITCFVTTYTITKFKNSDAKCCRNQQNNFTLYFKVLYMEAQNYLKDISDIKNMMNRSSRFLSLSGLSGVLAGVYALIGAYLGYEIIYATNEVSLDGYRTIFLTDVKIFQIIMIALSVIALSMITGAALSYYKAKKQGESMWDSTSKRLLVNFLIPLITGGLLIVILIEKEAYVLIAPLTLIFYGLACVNASKYTLGYIRYLGITLLILGLLSAYFLGYGLIFWALGFGVCHIIYGGIMHFKYDRMK